MQYIFCFICARCRDAEVPKLCTVLAGMGTSGTWPILAANFTDRIQLDLADSDLLQPSQYETALKFPSLTAPPLFWPS